MAITQKALQQVNYTKFVPPRVRKKAVTRTRLIEFLCSSSENKVTLICAPEGYGKTSLLSGWYHQRVLPNDRMKSLWFRVDESDRDPHCFWRNLVAAMEPCWEGVADSVVDNMDPHDSSSPLQLIIALANYIVNASDETLEYLLVLDNFERFCHSESEGQFVSFAEMVPDNVRFVIASKAYPGVGLMESDPLVGLTKLESAELAIGKEELEMLLGEDGVSLLPDQIDQLLKATEGWPLAERLYADSYMRGLEHEECLANLSDDESMISESIFRKAFESLPGHIRSFLLNTGFFEEISAEMCDCALEQDGSNDCIRFLIRNGVFTFPANHRRRTYRYHALFGAWLRKQASKHLIEEEIRVVNHRAAYWHHQQGNWNHAAKHAIAASEGGFVVGLTKAVFKDSKKSERDLLNWVFDYEAESIASRPFFCMMAAWTYVFFGRPNEAIDWVRRARAIVGGNEESNSTTTETEETSRPIDDALMKSLAQSERTIRAKTLVLEGRYADGVNAIAAIQSMEGGALDERLCMVLDQSLGEAQEMGGNLNKAMQSYRAALVRARVLEYDFLIAFIRYQIAHLRLIQGEANAAYELCVEALENCPHDFTVYGALNGMLCRIHTLRGELEEAQHALQRAFSYVSADRNLDMYLDVCIAYIELTIAKGNYSDALYQATVALQAISGSGYTPPRGTAVQVFAKQALAFALTGDADSTHAAIESRPARGYRDTEEGHYLDGLSLAPLAERSPESAKPLAEQLELLTADARAKNYVLHELTLSIALVRLWHIAGYHEKALRSLRNALDIARSGRLVQPILNGGEIVRVLLAESVGSRQSDYGYLKFARLVLSAFDSKSGEPADTGSDIGHVELPDGMTSDDLDYMEHWGLTLRELDVLRLLMRGVKRKGIASELCTSENTVKTHIAHIYEKMDAHSVPELLRRITEYQSA